MKLTEKDQIDLFQPKEKPAETQAPAAFENPQKGFRGNLGEWSEVYTFLKMLADGFLNERHEDHQHKKVTRRLTVVNVIKEHPTPTLYHVASKNEPTFKCADIFVRDSDGEGGFSPISSKVIPRAQIKLACAELGAVLKNHISQRGAEIKAVFVIYVQPREMIASISTRTSRGSFATCTVERAGQCPSNVAA